ncbi:unnamed protein product [marine sediment metagenome]|uniref:Lcl C-terminal domain-containing protein n=1 Tax=marine sediment metagenome TaxID=412755 RepID=X1H6X4_9ZZZZ
MQMRTKQTILTRLLPKTGQQLEVLSGDDGTYQAGWWKGVKSQPQSKRFIAKTIGVDNVVIDLATGLMWSKFGNGYINNGGAAITWPLAIAHPIGKTFAGFTDWRLGNVLELISIINFAAFNPAIYDEFFAVYSHFAAWTGTTYIVDDTVAWTVNFLTGLVGNEDKTATHAFYCCRGGV